MHSYERYDRENGIAVYAAPSVKPGKAFIYFDPIDQLSPAARERWKDEVVREEMIHEALRNAGVRDEALVVA